MTGRPSLCSMFPCIAMTVACNIAIAADTPALQPLAQKLDNECQHYVDQSKDSTAAPTTRKQSGDAAHTCLDSVQTGVEATVAAVKNSSVPANEKLAVVDDATAITSKLKTQQKEATDATNAANSQSNFLGVSWGLGVGYAFGEGPRRVTATLVNNIVRVSSDVTNGPRVFLEAHYYPEWWTSHSGYFGWGPFATVEAGTSGSTASNGISGFGLGLMAGFKVPGTTTSSGFNVGVGYLWEGNVQTLGDGIVANQALPTGETQIRYKNRSVGAIAVLFSWKFGFSLPTTAAKSGT